MSSKFSFSRLLKAPEKSKKVMQTVVLGLSNAECAFCSRPIRDIISPACPWCDPGSPPRWAYLEHLPREASKRHPDQMPKLV